MEKYFIFFLQNTHDYLTNRFRFFIILVATFIAPLVVMMILSTVPGRTINGMTKDQIVTYYLVTSILFVFLNSRTDYFVKEAIQDGQLAIYLIKPIHFWTVAFVKDFSLRVLRLVTGLPLFIALVFLFRESFIIPMRNEVLLFILMIIISYLLVFSYSYTVGLLAFWLEEVWGLQNVKEVSLILLSGTALPYSFFPEALRVFLTFTPFPYFINWPLRKGFSGNILLEFIIAITWVGIFSLLNYWLWKRGLKRYSAVGTY